MEFEDNKAIYLQIADSLCEKILSGELQPGVRLPSVREWGATIGVNPNTVVRSYDFLMDRGVIYNKRGIGCFVSDDAPQKIVDIQRKEFIEKEIPAFLRRASLLGVDLKEYIL